MRPYWFGLTGLVILDALSAPLFLLTPLPLKMVVDSVLGSRPLPGFLALVVPRNAALVLLLACLLQVLVALL
ncbi:MAG: ABC transporter ATP-binding protein, partial [Candidatus Dormibacteraeota bacterium]|nr:ABC transporter ATP-binding protein [Candidatus Dormibacteraeota bacterium]